jgi:hypothetical protein
LRLVRLVRRVELAVEEAQEVGLVDDLDTVS